jgi:hypothetical protein
MTDDFEAPDFLPSEPLRWKLTERELREMTPEDRDIYINEKINRIYDALMMHAEADSSGNAVIPEDTIAILHPERKDDFKRLRNRDRPEH